MRTMAADSAAERREGSHGLDAHSTSVVCRLRLKPGCPSLDNVLKQPQVIDVLSDEYVAQYLEHIGARPSKATAELVRANAPFSAACIKAGHKAEGLAENELLLTAPPVQLDAPVRPLVPKHQAEQVAAVLEATRHSTADIEERLRCSRQASTSGEHGEDAASTAYGFQGMSARKMYPFNLKNTLARTEKARKAAAAGDLASTLGDYGSTGSTQAHGHSAVGTSAKPASAQMQRTSFGGAAVAAAEPGAQKPHGSAAPAPLSQDALTELLQDFRPDYDHLMSIQEDFGASLQQWFERLSPGVTDGQVCNEDVAATATLLASADVMKLAITLLNWLYYEYVVGSPVFPGQPSIHGAKRAPTLRPWLAQRGRPTSKTHASHPEQYDLGFQLLVQQHVERSAAAAAQASTGHVDASNSSHQRMGLGSREASMDGSRGSLTGFQRASGSAGHYNQQAAAFGANGGRRLSAAGPAMPTGARQLPLHDCASKSAQPLHGLQQASFRRLSSHSSASGVSSAQVSATAAEAAITASLSTPQGIKELQQCRLVALLQQWQKLQDELKRSRVSLFFTMPVLLLSLRALTEQLFASSFTAWLRSPHGAAAAAAMDSALLQLLDPSGYHSQMPLLQSTPAAVRLCQSFPRRWHAQELSHYHDTSTLLKAAVGMPASPEARRMLAQQATRGQFKRSGTAGSRSGAQCSAARASATAGGAIVRLQLSSKLEQEGQQQLLRQTLPAKLRSGKP